MTNENEAANTDEAVVPEWMTPEPADIVEALDRAVRLRGQVLDQWPQPPSVEERARDEIQFLHTQLTAATQRAEQLDRAMRLTDELFSTAFKQGSEEQHLWLFGDEGIDAWQTVRAIIYGFNHEFHSEQAREFFPMKERAEQAERMLAERDEALDKCREQFKFYADEHEVKRAAALKEWDDACYWGNVAEQDAKRKEYAKRTKQTEVNRAFVIMIDAIRSAASGEQGA